MSHWECSICGYVHKEETPPEKCPVCDASAKMFEEVKAVKEEKPENQEIQEKQEDQEDQEIQEIQEKQEKQEAAEPAGEPGAAAVKRWRCTVCGYVHTGEEPPDKCPICDAPKEMFVEIDDEGKALGEPKPEEAGYALPDLKEKGKKKSASFFDRFVAFSLKHHLHPVLVHFPNGILPAVVIFLALSVYFNVISLEVAAYYNLIFVLLMLPIVLFTGFIEWQKRYKGIKSAIFITKIMCSLVVLALVGVLVFWRLIDPKVAAEGSSFRLIYLGIAAIMLGFTAFAGYLGGKLFFGARGN